MRHGRKINHLGRTSAHRQALLSNMASSLILSKNKRITTTLAKAKALRVYIEPLLTRSKEDSTQSRRVVFSYLQNKEAVTELFREVATKIAQRPGGYTRILKTENRLGDNAQMCIMELVDYNENLIGEKQEKKAKTTRRGRGGAKKVTAETGADAEAVTKAPRKKSTKKAADEKVEKTDAPADDVKTDETSSEN
ncbi:MAG TPA: 50S ribosomal protein L17 [Bacteroidales bacterium]|nr:50S ribosomal protein L17 [Bacteroidales bacterium]HPS18240.1 50S ribosomal protein L17 [Bacteroidales bacterium]